MSKDLGNQMFKAKDYAQAIAHYSQAIEENPTDHTVFSNRAASYHNMKKYQEALADGEKCIQIKPDWGKGYQRKALALHGLGQLENALQAYEEGISMTQVTPRFSKAFRTFRWRWPVLWVWAAWVVWVWQVLASLGSWGAWGAVIHGDQYTARAGTGRDSPQSPEARTAARCTGGPA